MPSSSASVRAVVDFDLEEVLELYRAVQWITYTNNPQVLQAALAGSSRIVVARVDGHLVGLARVISDGATIAYLQDVLVHPDHRRAGIGAALVHAALTPTQPSARRSCSPTTGQRSEPSTNLSPIARPARTRKDHSGRSSALMPDPSGGDGTIKQRAVDVSVTDRLATTSTNEALMNPILDTGHGTSIDVQTLNGVIHDEAAFAVWAGQGVDPVLHVIGPLFRGDLDAAQAALDRLSVAADPKVQFRLHALGADILRDRGQFAEAVHRYELLLVQYAGTSREAVLRQHLGKVHFTAGNLWAARDDFAAALKLRRAQGADADLIESSVIALRRADEEISRVQQPQNEVPDS